MSCEPLNHFLPNLVWWSIIMWQCVVWKKNGLPSSMSRSQRGLISYIIKIWLFTISSKLLIRLQPNLLCWYSITSHGITGFKVKVTVNVQTVSECLSRPYLLTTEYFVAKPGTICSIISQSVKQKKWFTVFSVKVTVWAYIIKIWLFLLYFVNSWLFCSQTWFDSTAS